MECYDYKKAEGGMKGYCIPFTVSSLDINGGMSFGQMIDGLEIMGARVVNAFDYCSPETIKENILRTQNVLQFVFEKYPTMHKPDVIRYTHSGCVLEWHFSSGSISIMIGKEEIKMESVIDCRMNSMIEKVDKNMMSSVAHVMSEFMDKLKDLRKV